MKSDWTKIRKHKKKLEIPVWVEKSLIKSVDIKHTVVVSLLIQEMLCHSKNVQNYNKYAFFSFMGWWSWLQADNDKHGNWGLLYGMSNLWGNQLLEETVTDHLRLVCSLIYLCKCHLYEYKVSFVSRTSEYVTLVLPAICHLRLYNYQ